MKMIKKGIQYHWFMHFDAFKNDILYIVSFNHNYDIFHYGHANNT